MGGLPGVKYWIFSNKAKDEYGGNDWDMSTILGRQQYYLKKDEPNCKHVRPGDIVFMRIFGDCYFGRFIVEDWVDDPDGMNKYGVESGYFRMASTEIWNPPLPQFLVIRDLENGNMRRRIISIKQNDVITIETAQHIYERLGFGGKADAEFVILEKGIEELVKDNISQFGLHLADEKIRQQCVLGVGIGRSDLICLDTDGNLVVLELKRGIASDKAIGQLMRYVGYIEKHIAATGQLVYGALVAPEFDEQTRWAAEAAHVKLYLVRLG